MIIVKGTSKTNVSVLTGILRAYMSPEAGYDNICRHIVVERSGSAYFNPGWVERKLALSPEQPKNYIIEFIPSPVEDIGQVVIGVEEVVGKKGQFVIYPVTIAIGDTKQSLEWLTPALTRIFSMMQADRYGYELVPTVQAPRATVAPPRPVTNRPARKPVRVQEAVKAPAEQLNPLAALGTKNDPGMIEDLIQETITDGVPNQVGIHFCDEIVIIRTEGKWEMYSIEDFKNLPLPKIGTLNKFAIELHAELTELEEDVENLLDKYTVSDEAEQYLLSRGRV